MGRHKDADTLNFIDWLKKKGESLDFFVQTEYSMLNGLYFADMVWKLEEDQESFITFEVETRDTPAMFSNTSKYFGPSSNVVKKPWWHFMIVYKSRLSEGHRISMFNTVNQYNI